MNFRFGSLPCGCSPTAPKAADEILVTHEDDRSSLLSCRLAPLICHAFAARNQRLGVVVAEHLAVIGRSKRSRLEFSGAAARTLGRLLLAKFAAGGAAVSGVVHPS